MLRRIVLAAGVCATVFLLASTPVRAAGGGGGGGGGGLDSQDELKSKEYKAGVAAIKAKNWQGGIDWMTKAVAVTPKDADAYNWLGYSHRKLGHYPEALENYKKALELDPDHRGVREYLGEAYLEMNQLDEAKKQLAALDKLCFLPCEQYSELKEAVEKYEKTKKGA